jgi:hypothetical protein
MFRAKLCGTAAKELALQVLFDFATSFFGLGSARVPCWRLRPRDPAFL